MINLAHLKNALAMMTSGTGQEGSSMRFIENLAMVSKTAEVAGRSLALVQEEIFGISHTENSR